MLYPLPASLLVELRAHQAAARAAGRGGTASQIALEDAHDAFLLEPGAEPEIYLTSAGRVVMLGEFLLDDDAGVDVSIDDAVVALVTGAARLGVPALTSILPPAPADAHTCPACLGRRWASPEAAAPRVCSLCRGRGWALRFVIERAVVRGAWPPACVDAALDDAGRLACQLDRHDALVALCASGAIGFDAFDTAYGRFHAAARLDGATADLPRMRLLAAAEPRIALHREIAAQVTVDGLAPDEAVRRLQALAAQHLPRS